jgi:hypothetical protein
MVTESSAALVRTEPDNSFCTSKTWRYAELELPGTGVDTILSTLP